ncbi:MAG: glycogen/starch synthase [Sedimenticola sp.]|nr:glycogen/starch synthase [Sedimenticola sp.]
MNRDLSQAPLRILLASGEARSLAGSGELAEFTETLCMTLGTLGHDVRLVLPAYPQVLAQKRELKQIARLRLPGCDTMATLLQGKLDNGCTLYLLQMPGLFDREGDPYRDPEGTPWRDNGRRFGLFSRAVSLLAINQAGLNWQPDLLHCAGWGSALPVALVAGEWNRPATVYSMHQTAHVTLDSDQITPLALPVDLLKSGALTIEGGFSFERAAAITADRVLLPSNGYRDELLQTPGTHPLSRELLSRQEQVKSIFSGIDYQRWSPTTDPFIEQHFDSASFELKQLNRKRLCEQLALPVEDGSLLLGYLPDEASWQEIELLKGLMERMEHFPSLHIVASVGGDHGIRQATQDLAKAYPRYFTLGGAGDEALKHRILASSDCLLLPAPAYPSARPALAALGYGTIPIAHATAAMRESLTDATAANLMNGVASGFLYSENRVEPLADALDRATRFRAKPAIWWQKLAQHVMGQSFPPSRSAADFIELYHGAIDYPAGNPVAGSV